MRGSTRSRDTLVSMVLLLLVGCATAPSQSVHDAQAATPSSARALAPEASDYWDWRLSYPTGRFDASWLAPELNAERQRKSVLPLTSGDSSKALAVAGWLNPNRATPLGPLPLNWGTTDLPFGKVGGRVNVLLTHPTNAAVAWFGSDGGGVWKTNNCCGPETSWAAKTDTAQLSNISIGALALDPNNANVIYAGTGDHRRNRPFTFGAGGLLRSNDAGETWQVLGAEVFNPVYAQPAGNFPQYRAISAIVIDPLDSRRIAVGTNQGLYFSIDAGAQWTGPCFTNAFNTQRQDITGLLRRGSNNGGSELIVAVGALGRTSTVRPDLLQSGANGIYRGSWPTTASCPSDWSLISRANNGWPANSGNGIARPQPNANPLRRIDLAIAPSDANLIYAQVESLGVWRSADGGNTWIQRAIQPADFAAGCVADSFESGMQFQSYNAGLIVSPTDANTLFLSATDIWRSTNGGDTFTNLSCGYGETAAGVRGIVHVDNHARAFVANNPERLLIGNDGGVNYSANALASNVVFNTLNGGASTIEFYSGDITANFDSLDASMRAISGGAQDNGGSGRVWSAADAPGPGEWTLRQAGDGIATHIEPIRAERWYYSAQFGFIGASTTGVNGAALTDVTPTDDWQGDRRGFLAPFTLYKFGGEDTCPAAIGCQRMLAGTMRVWESITGGIPNTSWYPTGPDLTKALASGNDLSIINKVEHAPSDATRAIAATNDGNVWMARALGSGSANSAVWVNVTGNNNMLPNRPIMDAQIHPSNTGIAYVSLAGFNQNTPTTPGHVYQLNCTNDCAVFSWRNVSGDLPNIPVNAIQIDPNQPQRAFAGTDWGLYFTDNIEAAAPLWQKFSGGLPSVMIWDLVVDRGASTLAIFTRSRGAWVWPLRGGNTRPNLTGLWYKPGEGGWGVSIAHQGDILFPVWYTYNAQGRPVWYTSTPTRQADGSFLGDVYRFDGTPFNLINGPAYQPAVTVGSARYTPLPDDSVRLDYSIAGISQSKLLQRIAPGTPPICRFTTQPRNDASNHTDIWWNQPEPGWGIYITEAGTQIFLTWYTFANDGKAMWVTGLLTRDSSGTFVGALNRPNIGTPFDQINGPATPIPVPEVGTATLRFSDGQTGIFSYTLDGISQQKPIARVVYSGPERTVCD
jgi:hypothetical protein